MSSLFAVIDELPVSSVVILMLVFTIIGCGIEHVYGCFRYNGICDYRWPLLLIQRYNGYQQITNDANLDDVEEYNIK